MILDLFPTRARGTSGSCWRVADVISPNGISTLRAIEAFRTRYGYR